MNVFKKVLATAALAIILLPISLSPAASAADSINDLLTPFYQPGAINCVSGGTVYKFVQTLAYHESRDNPEAYNASGPAYGKYQYKSDTWQTHAASYYNPASQYNDDILKAPPSVQDALAFIEYSVQSIKYGGDLQKMAASHYLPAYADDPSVWPYKGSNPTLQEYVDQFMAQYNAGDGQDVPLAFDQAPDFDTQYTKAVGHAYSPGGDGLGASCGIGGPAGSFIFYDQTDPTWGSTQIYSGNFCDTPPRPDDISCAGCGPTSAAMVIATLKDSSVTPDMVGEFMTSLGSGVGYTNEGATGDGLRQAVEHWGLKTVSVNNMDDAIQLIKSGGLVIAGGAGNHPFSEGGHVVVLRGIDVSGNMLVGNPSLPLNDNDKNHAYPVDTIMAGLKFMIGVTQ